MHGYKWPINCTRTRTSLLALYGVSHGMACGMIARHRKRIALPNPLLRCAAALTRFDHLPYITVLQTRSYFFCCAADALVYYAAFCAADPAVKAIAATHQVSAAQVAMRWVVQQGCAVVTATGSAEYMTEDLDVPSSEE